MPISLTVRLRKQLAALISCLLTLALSACGSSSANYNVSAIGPKIHVGIVEDAPGIGFIRSGQRSGLDVEVSRYIIHELGFVPSEIVWHTVEPLDRENLLRNGTLNMVVGGYSITQERKSQIDFAGPYFTDGQDLMVRKDDHRIRSVEDLSDERVCTVRGSTSTSRLKEHAPNVQVEERKRIDICATALLTGQVDVVSADSFILYGVNKVWGGGQLHVLGAPFTSEYYGVAVRQGQPTLVKEINAAIASMIADGTWQRIVQEAAQSVTYPMTISDHRPRAIDGNNSTSSR